jgi:hypothetical protein
VAKRVKTRDAGPCGERYECLGRIPLWIGDALVTKQAIVVGRLVVDVVGTLLVKERLRVPDEDDTVKC